MSPLDLLSGAPPVVVAILPFAALVLACFVKIAVVLAVLQSGIGGRALPPRSVGFIVALTFTAVVVAPVAERMWQAAQPALSGARPDGGQAAMRASEPLREFFLHHTAEREREHFIELGRRLRSASARPAVAERDWAVLLPAFVTGELSAAFILGFLVLLPFLVIELVVANLLLVLGLHSLSARSVALPFKLLVFVLADGWHLVARGLVMGYGG